MGYSPGKAWGGALAVSFLAFFTRRRGLLLAGRHEQYVSVAGRQFRVEKHGAGTRCMPFVCVIRQTPSPHRKRDARMNGCTSSPRTMAIRQARPWRGAWPVPFVFFYQAPRPAARRVVYAEYVAPAGSF